MRARPPVLKRALHNDFRPAGSIARPGALPDLIGETVINEHDSTDGPSAAELAAIEDEMPLIEAEIDLVDVQIRIMQAHGPVDDVTVQRLRRSRNAVVAETLRWYARRFNLAHRAA
jgi:hypothetical protein